MEITWHEFAIQDVRELLQFIALENQQAAYQIYEEIEDQIAILQDFPQAGRLGRVEGTRELVIVRTPFIAVYHVIEDEVTMLRILHGARRWP